MNIQLKLEKYLDQYLNWPNEGKHILAQYDDDSIIVYQAFNHVIANAAVSNQTFNCNECFKSGYNIERMSWIKTNFLWMMFRSGWASKTNQERILAIRLKRSGFEEILKKSMGSTVCLENELKKNVCVRLQWDPDHLPNGDKITNRRAIQLGLKGDILKTFSNEYLLNIYDITDFVVDQRDKCILNNDYSQLLIPKEEIYKIQNPDLIQHIGLTII